MKYLLSLVLFTLLSCSANAQNIADFQGSFQYSPGRMGSDTFAALLVLKDSTFELVTVSNLHIDSSGRPQCLSDLLASNSPDIQVTGREKGSWRFTDYDPDHNFTTEELYHGLGGHLYFPNGRSQYFTAMYCNGCPMVTIIFMDDSPASGIDPHLSYWFHKTIDKTYYTN